MEVEEEIRLEELRLKEKKKLEEKGDKVMGVYNWLRLVILIILAFLLYVAMV